MASLYFKTVDVDPLKIKSHNFPLHNKPLMNIYTHMDLSLNANVLAKDYNVYSLVFERRFAGYIDERLKNPAAKTRVSY